MAAVSDFRQAGWEIVMGIWKRINQVLKNKK